MSRPLLVFISGPYSAPDAAGIWANIARATAVGVDVIEAGHFPVIPHVLSQGVHEAHNQRTGVELTWEWWMTYCESVLAKCDAVLCYGESPGANREVAHAGTLGIPVVTEVDDLAVLTAWEVA